MGSISVASVATQFLDRPGYAVATLKSYESTLLPFLQDFGAVSIERLSREHLESYLNGLGHLSLSTHRRHQAIIQSFLNFAVERGHLKSNPIQHLKQRRPRVEQGEVLVDEPLRYLNADQLQRLYQAVRLNARMNALVHLLHRTGARISELLSLDLEQVDFNELKFQVIGKGNKQRWCFFNEGVESQLQRYIRYARHSSHPALFTAQHPTTDEITRLSYSSVYKSWKRITRAEPLLNDVRLHDLRHTFATERVGLMGIEELRALMGHEQIQTTLRYQKVTSARAQTVAQNALNQLMNGNENNNY